MRLSYLIRTDARVLFHRRAADLTRQFLIHSLANRFPVRVLAREFGHRCFHHRAHFFHRRRAGFSNRIADCLLDLGFGSGLRSGSA